MYLAVDAIFLSNQAILTIALTNVPYFYKTNASSFVGQYQLEAAVLACKLSPEPRVFSYATRQVDLILLSLMS